MLGLYIHVPFCKSKCPYCDFYSKRGMVADFDAYAERVCNSLLYWHEKLNKKADTLYFGGGTPSLIGGDNIAKIVLKSKELFGIDNFSEVTVECNPSTVDENFFNKISTAGVNRISLGMQSAVDNERKKLGRNADKNKITEVIKAARDCGIKNISLDVMLGVPGQTRESLNETIEFCINSGVEHISAYMLSLEKGTWFYKNHDKLNLPNDDTVADMFLILHKKLEDAGYIHYEISNFAKKNYESKHNLKYWKLKEYLGIGPAAHSFIDNKRFFYERNIDTFMGSEETKFEGDGGDIEEYIMLRLRILNGLCLNEAEKGYKMKFQDKFYIKLNEFCKSDYSTYSDGIVSLTPKGFLVSNRIISDLLENL